MIRLGDAGSPPHGSTTGRAQASALVEPVVVTVSALLDDARDLVVRYERLLADAKRVSHLPASVGALDQAAEEARQVAVALAERAARLTERIAELRTAI